MTTIKQFYDKVGEILTLTNQSEYKQVTVTLDNQAVTRFSCYSSNSGWIEGKTVNECLEDLVKKLSGKLETEDIGISDEVLPTFTSDKQLELPFDELETSVDVPQEEMSDDVTENEVTEALLEYKIPDFIEVNDTFTHPSTESTPWICTSSTETELFAIGSSLENHKALRSECTLFRKYRNPNSDDLPF